MDLYNDPTVITIPLTCSPKDNGAVQDDHLNQFVEDDLHVLASEIRMVAKKEYVLIVKFAPQDRFHYQLKYK